jgi:hypothetical protein
MNVGLYTKVVLCVNCSAHSSSFRMKHAFKHRLHYGHGVYAGLEQMISFVGGRLAGDRC